MNANPPPLPAPDDRPLLAAPGPAAARTAPPASPSPPDPDSKPKPDPDPDADADAKPDGKRHAKAISAVMLVAFLSIAFALGWFFHHRRADAAEAANQQQREQMPMASVIAAKRSPGLSELLLPGSLAPLTEAALYARAAGYVRRRFVDIGDTVKKGQVLAEIESPELDQQAVQSQAATAQARQQLNQARATIGDARAKLELARLGWQRWDVLRQANAVAAQDADQKRQEYDSAQSALAQAEANVGSAAENVRAAEANQRRVSALRGFERLRAPFDGVVTARNVDEGALIGSNGAGLSGAGSTSSTAGASTTASATAGSSDASAAGGSQSSGPPLFRLAQVDRLRVYVTVPQGNATAIQVGSDATVLIQEFERPVAGRVSRTARSLDPDSRTLLTEVQIDNRDHRLMSGMYVQVRFASARSNPPLLVPGEALIVRGNGVRVAVVGGLGADERARLQQSPDARCARQVYLQPVTVGRDYGTEVEVTKGLRAGDFVIVNPGDTVHDKAVLLPHLQTDAAGGDGDKTGGGKQGGDKTGGDKQGGDKQGDAKGGTQGGGGPGRSDEEQPERREAEQTCLEEAAQKQAARRPMQAEPVRGDEAGQALTSGLAPGGESEKAPSGIQSPSMAAPTQGQKK